MAVATLDHIGLSVSDYDKAKAFYTAALAPLGIGVQMEFPTPNGKAMGMGTPGAAFLWISGGGKETPRAHFAIRARSPGKVYPDGARATGLPRLRRPRRPWPSRSSPPGLPGFLVPAVPAGVGRFLLLSRGPRKPFPEDSAELFSIGSQRI